MDIDTLTAELKAKEARILELQLALMEKRIGELEHTGKDHEDRIRTVETSRTRFETMALLAFGGGALSFINLIQTWVKP